jgi:hypothetical protein
MAIGVEVITKTQTGPSTAGPRSSRFQVAGVTERGPVDANLIVKSLAQFESVFGVRTAYASNIYDTARTYWEEGGTELVVSRAVGDSASAGFLVLEDRAVAPVDTLRIEAASVGAHSAELKVEITDGAVDDTFDFLLTVNDTLVTALRNLASPAALVAALAGNPYVRATTLGSATAAPDNNPAALPATAVSTGADDRADVTNDTLIAALARPVKDLAGVSVDIEGSAVAVPGYTADSIGVALIAHAKATGKIALLAPGVDATPESVGVMGRALITADGSYGGLFYPHIVVPDGAGTRTLSPEGYVAAVRSRAHTDVGFWQAAPGQRAVTRWVLGTSVGVDKTTNNLLAESQVNGLVTVGGRVRLYGWASLSTDKANFALLSARDTLNNITASLRVALEPYVFANVDSKGHLLSAVEAAAYGVLDPIAVAGGFFARLDPDGEQIDPGYRVIVDETLNTSSSLANNEVRLSVAVRLSPVAALISVEIIKVALTASV